MSKAEKEAIEYIKELIKPPLREEWDFAYKLDKTTAKQFKTLLNYIDRLQEENEDMREELQMYVDTDIMKLREENKDLKKEIDNLIKENHKHIDYIARMKKKHEDKIRNKIKELEQATAEELRYDFLMNRDEVKRAVIEILEEVLGDDE